MKKIGLVLLISSILVISGCGWRHHHHRHGAVDIPTDTRLT